jgi:hypothetical protein
MEKFLRGLAYLGNLGVLVMMAVLFAENRPYGIEVLWFFLLFALPLLNLWLLWNGPDCEERKLRRAVAKAELRQRLKELGGV